MAQADGKHNVPYTIKKADMLYNLVISFYGGPLNKNYYLNKIRAINKIDDINKIHEGQKIIMPSVPNNYHELCYVKRIQKLKSKYPIAIPKPPNDKREHWMMLVVWTVIHHFHCKVVGGFVRDFIIRGEKPNDIDIVLPPNVDINNFANQLHKKNE